MECNKFIDIINDIINITMSNHESNPHILGPMFSSSNVTTSGGITMLRGLHYSTTNNLESEDKLWKSKDHECGTRYVTIFLNFLSFDSLI